MEEKDQGREAWGQGEAETRGKVNPHPALHMLRGWPASLGTPRHRAQQAGEELTWENHPGPSSTRAQRILSRSSSWLAPRNTCFPRGGNPQSQTGSELDLAHQGNQRPGDLVF